MNTRMKLLTIMIASFATGFFVSRSMQQRDTFFEDGQGKDVYAPASASLSASQVSDLMIKAEKGDLSAMRKLYLHHEFVSGDDIEAQRWQRRMADAGDVESRAAIMSRLVLSSEEGRVGRENILGVCTRWYKN